MNRSNTSAELVRKREIKATKKIIIIVSIFFISWIPTQIINIINLACQDLIRNKYYLIEYSGFVLVHLKSAINPMLFAYHLPDFRRALLKLVGKKKLEENSSVVNNRQSKL
jgi:hypothetical protein